MAGRGEDTAARPAAETGGGGVSVARAVGWGPEDRDGAPAGLRHRRSREGAGTCGCQGPLGPPRWPTWPGIRSTGCSCILGIRFRPERETETEIQRREGGEGAVPLPRRNPPAHMCKKSTSVFLLVDLTLPSGPTCWGEGEVVSSPHRPPLALLPLQFTERGAT